MKDYYDVFVSYSHKDSEWVHNWLLPNLKAAGVELCIDRDDFDPGAPAIVNMEEAVKRSNKTLGVMTKDWIDSEWADYEALLTRSKDPAGRRRQFVPILLKDCELPDRISMLTYLNFRDSGNHDHELLRLINTLRPAVVRDVRVAQLPYFAHPYPLPPNFTGRVDERKLLTEWYTTDNHPVFVYEAIGGMGKSAVTWVWVQRDVLGLPVPGIVGEQPEGCAVPDNKRPAGIFWWSFYEADAKFGAFLNAALRYVGLKFDKDTSEHDKLLALVNILYQNRLLFVLDGFERELRAYASMNAAYQGEKIAQDKQGDFRSCIDPRAAVFLRSVASQPLASRILMTTRLHPKELENLAYCRHENLSSFSVEDTLAFFHAQGIDCTRAEVVDTCQECGYHPLSLNLLAGMIKGSLRNPDDIAVIRGCKVVENLKGKQRHHILAASYDTLQDDQKTLLSKLAAFRNPITFETASIFKAEGQSEADFEAALKNLLDRGLIFQEGKLLDFHPIIRSYAYDRLTDREGVHSQLCDYFKKVPSPEGKIQTLEELNPVIELYHHTV
ncbi:toll/interleukin-1 receptor domain-containing protein, partial [bacterium]